MCVYGWVRVCVCAACGPLVTSAVDRSLAGVRALLPPLVLVAPGSRLTHVLASDCAITLCALLQPFDRLK